MDEIVLGLSAAKEQSLFPDSLKKAITPSVTVTPTSLPTSSSHGMSQKPFTITVTSVPSSAPSTTKTSTIPVVPTLSNKDSFSTYLAQQQKPSQRKNYEAMIADINKDFSKVNSFSHEAKVNKWLAEQNAALAEQPLGSDYLNPRRRRPRVDPTLLDWKKLTGDENVAVINRVTGKKLTGPKAPTLKRLGQWLIENPMYDIDPKWADLVKERGILNNDMQKRVQGNSSSSSKQKTQPGRPPLLASPTGSTSSVSSANLVTSMASSLPFPSLAGSGMSGLNSSLLSGLSSLGQFDPKNPLLMPFAGMPNMNALSSMGGLGNLTNMNLFANLAGLGLPGLAGMDAAAAAAALTGETSSKSSSSSTSSSKAKQQKPSEAHSSSKTQSSSSSSIPTSTPFPFFFPNPSLLYTPIGLAGLNPFSLQPGMTAAYDTLAQQCGLLNGGLNPVATPTSKSSKSSRAQTSTTTSTSLNSSTQSGKSRSGRDTTQLAQQLLLPPDTHLLESISKAAGLDAASFKQSKSDKKDDKRKALESLRGMLPTDFTNFDKKGKKDNIPGFADFSKLLEASAVASTSKKPREQEMKEALEQLSKTNAEFLARAMAEEQQHQQQQLINQQLKATTAKRQRESLSREILESPTACEETPAKKLKESILETSIISMPAPIATIPTLEVGGTDFETLLPPSTVVKAGMNLEIEENKEKCLDNPLPLTATTTTTINPTEIETITGNVGGNESNVASESANETDNQTESQDQQQDPTATPKKNATKRTRGKRKSGELPIDPESIREKKNLRSSASRSAAAAAARAEREQAAAKLLEAEKAQEQEGA